MMKKILRLFIYLTLLITITGCGNNSLNNVSNEDNVENKVTESDNETNETNETTNSKFKSINFNEQINLDFVELNLTTAMTGKEIKPENPKGVYRYSSKQEGKTYFYVYGTIKNIGKENFEFADSMYVEFVFDDNYTYNGSVKADEEGSFSYIYAYLDPLESEKIYFTVSVPDELIEKYQNVELKFGFKKNFEGHYNTYEDCDYLYSIKINK